MSTANGGTARLRNALDERVLLILKDRQVDLIGNIDSNLAIGKIIY